jgi:hypothetical protein
MKIQFVASLAKNGGAINNKNRMCDSRDEMFNCKVSVENKGNKNRIIIKHGLLTDKYCHWKVKQQAAGHNRNANSEGNGEQKRASSSRFSLRQETIDCRCCVPSEARC